jgi:2-isopropylmalate synthase
MTKMPIGKYRAFQPIDLPDRKWPTRRATKAPTWCSVDLRDGNQALVEPMGRHRKIKFFSHLVEIGFKEIEVGFPAASETDFDFVRYIIEHNLIPEDVTIQVLTQARPELIERTYESLVGARKAIVHLYNSTSTLQRRVVFGLDRAGIKKIATDGAAVVKRLAPKLEAGGTDVRFEYSPESFTGTELDYALEVCEAVLDVLGASAAKPVIINLPATVEMATPNIYADQIEWMDRNFRDRARVILSLHPHNDRGTGIAAAELGVLAGADRVEGTLFGNGERTGNVDLVTLCLNLFTQGVDPGIDFSDIDGSIEVATYCNQLPVHERHPYAGRLVHTAFSGSHQDAIKKGMIAQAKSNSGLWEVPYLPIDPKDIGRSYEEIIRVNSQSGKGGVAYILQSEYGLELPRDMQIDFSKVVQKVADESGKEITPKQIWEIFSATYLDRAKPYTLGDYRLGTATHASEIIECSGEIRIDGAARGFAGRGNGPIAGFIDGINAALNVKANVLEYHQDALTVGAGSEAVCFIRLGLGGEQRAYGVGIHRNTNTASFRAVISALNRLTAQG